MGIDMGFERHGAREKVREEAGNGERQWTERRGSADGVAWGKAEKLAAGRRQETGVEYCGANVATG